MRADTVPCLFATQGPAQENKRVVKSELELHGLGRAHNVGGMSGD